MIFLEFYKKIFSEPNKWNYYNSTHSTRFPFENEEIANDFIIDYFKNGGKTRVIDECFKEGNERSLHTISTFFLGLIIEPLLIINRNNLNIKLIQDEEPDFIYFWFLLCLYHDFGYFIEYHKEKYSPKAYSLDCICKELNIEANLLKTKYKLNFTKSTIKKYYSLCRNKYGFINHGIIGGLLLFDRLKKNYEINKKEASAIGIEVENDDFIYNKLHWAKKHENYYTIVADTVISHNIWFSTDNETNLLYYKNKLENLIITNKEQRKSIINSLLGLLSLCDTIEPIKSFSQYEPECILSKLSIDILEVERKIQIKVLDNCINFKPWFKKIKDLEKWLKVKVEQYDNVLTIEIIE